MEIIWNDTWVLAHCLTNRKHYRVYTIIYYFQSIIHYYAGPTPSTTSLTTSNMAKCIKVRVAIWCHYLCLGGIFRFNKDIVICTYISISRHLKAMINCISIWFRKALVGLLKRKDRCVEWSREAYKGRLVLEWALNGNVRVGGRRWKCTLMEVSLGKRP